MEFMENIRLSWDLFIIVFFAVVIAYSFIVGRNQTIKIIISSYMAILLADAVGNLFHTYLVPTAPSLQGATGDQALVLVKILVFVFMIVLLAIKGAYDVALAEEPSALTRFLSSLTFGFLNAGLMVSALLVYLTGGSFVTGTVQANLYSNLYDESQFIRSLIDYYDIWFALPAVAIVIVSFFEPMDE